MFVIIFPPWVKGVLVKNEVPRHLRQLYSCCFSPHAWPGLALWPSGPLALWSSGPLVLWSSGYLVAKPILDEVSFRDRFRFER